MIKRNCVFVIDYDSSARIGITYLVEQRRIWRFTLLFVVLSLLFAIELGAQEKKGRAARRDSIKAVKIAEGRGIFTILAGPGYTPELKLLIAAGGLYSFTTNKEDSLIQRSTVNSSFGVTVPDGGIVSKAILTSFWKQDKIRIYANLYFKNIPDNYWGVGYDNGINTPKSDSTTAFEKLYWQFNPKFMFRLKKHMYIGPVLDFNQTIGKDESQGVLDDPVYQEFGSNNFNGGAGVVFQYDSRDIPVNAYRGTLLQVMGIFYGGYLGGVNNYQQFDIDFRNYQQVGKTDGQTLAWNIRGRFTTSDVPYAEMSQLGTPFDLRGYTWGRFRDKSMIYAIAEYRHMFMKRSTGERGKHGAVAWLAGGTIMNDVTDIANFLPNLGVGYRFEVQPRMNVRLDFGVGRDNLGFYFNFTEAF